MGIFWSSISIFGFNWLINIKASATQKKQMREELMYDGPMCAEEKRETEIQREIRRQSSLIAELKEALNHLGEKISPVLSGQLQENEGRCADSLTMTDLGRAIQGSNDQLVGAIETVARFIKRVEL